MVYSVTSKKRGNYYKCLGLYSKDPQKRAQAIAALKGNQASPSPLSQETGAFSTPTFAPKIPSGTEEELTKLKKKVMEQELTINKLEDKLASAEARHELQLEKVRLQVRDEMKDKISDAYKEGYQMCKDNLLDLRKFQAANGL
ncbi:hypothetical protein AB1Y20_021068 [Prymnesium parvum]|uniref:Uncharacterized protein n=1 Tax=Prymnesium parvum TaxID=97485 RepID=A0AB34JIK2_PRYPA